MRTPQHAGGTQECVSQIYRSAMIFVCSGDVVNHHGTQLFHGPDFCVQGLVRGLVTNRTVHLLLSQSTYQARLCLTICLGN